MNLVPFMIERDIEGFGKCLNRIQEIAFNKVEFQLQPPIITERMLQMRECCPGVGLSSLGPTLFGIYDHEDTSVPKEIKEKLGDSVEIIVTKAQNHGAVITP